MPGVFSKNARPPRPGAYFNWAAAPVETVLPNVGSIVALSVSHDWGPDSVIVATSSFSDFQAKFGPTATTDAYRAVKGAFKGEGISGRGGAGQVLVYRMAAASAAAAALTLGTLTLTALYKGSYGQNISVTVQTSATSGDDDLIIMVEGLTVETYTYVATDINSVRDQINANSAWVTATASATGTAITPATNQPLTGGNDGSTLTPAEYTSMMSVFGTSRFSIFAAGNLVDSAILASLKTWVVQLNQNGKRFMAVVGGDVGDTATVAIARSASLGDPNFVNVGVGTLIDDELGTLSTAQLAPRVAGILAQRGDSKSLTFARLQGTSAGTLPTDTDILSCFNGGVVVFSQDSNAISPIRVEKGLTTYTGMTDPNRPYLIYRNPKFLRTMQGIELEMTDWAAYNAIGELQVNDSTRAYVIGHAHEVIKARADRGVIQSGFTVGVDPDPPPSDEDEFIAVKYGIAFGRSVEQVFNTIFIS
jgi:hypothetical protein